MSKRTFSETETSDFEFLRKAINREDIGQIIDFLNKKGPQFAIEDAQSNRKQGSALFRAVETNKPQIVQILLENGYSDPIVINQERTVDFKTPINACICSAAPSGLVFQLLLQNGSNLHMSLYWAVMCQNEEIATYLLEIIPLDRIEADNGISFKWLVSSTSSSPTFLLKLLQKIRSEDSIYHIPTILATFINSLNDMPSSAERVELISMALEPSLNKTPMRANFKDVPLTDGSLHRTIQSTLFAPDRKKNGADIQLVKIDKFVDDADVLSVLFQKLAQRSEQDPSISKLIHDLDMYHNADDPRVITLLTDYFKFTDYNNIDDVDGNDYEQFSSEIAQMLALRSKESEQAIRLLDAFLSHPKIAAHRDKLAFYQVPMNIYIDDEPDEQNIETRDQCLPFFTADQLSVVLKAKLYVAFAKMALYERTCQRGNLFAITEARAFQQGNFSDSESTLWYFYSLAEPTFEIDYNGQENISNADQVLSNMRPFFHAFTVRRTTDMADLQLLSEFVTLLSQTASKFYQGAQQYGASEAQKIGRVLKLFDYLNESMYYTGYRFEDFQSIDENETDQPIGVLAPLIYKEIMKAYPQKGQILKKRYTRLREAEHRIQLVTLGLAPVSLCIDIVGKQRKAKENPAEAVDAILEVVTASYFICTELDYFAVDFEMLCQCLQRYYSARQVPEL